MTVVSDTSPICYLVLLESVDILPRLHTEILVTTTVLDELRHPDAPSKVRIWAQHPPAWLILKADPAMSDSRLEILHPGERTTIQLALNLREALVILDDADARRSALDCGLQVAGLLGVLRDAADLGLIDRTETVDRLRQTNFRASPELLRSILKEER